MTKISNDEKKLLFEPMNKPLVRTKSLFITEIFESIQGESRFAGFPTVFVRLSGCHLRCSWCDTKYSFSKGNKYNLPDLYEEIAQYSSKHICVTGGEPLLQESVYELLSHLCTEGYNVSIETSGSLSTEKIDPRVHIILDIKCPDSGMSEKNLFTNLSHLREIDDVKFVISSWKDFRYAVSICENYSLFDSPAQILFSPEFMSLEPKTLTEWILKEGLQVRLNIQWHKYIWSPTQQGV